MPSTPSSWRYQRMEDFDPSQKATIHPYATGERPLGTIGQVLVLPLNLLLVVAFPVRLAFLLCCLVAAGVVSFVGCLGLSMEGKKSIELTGLRRTIVGGLIGLIARGAMLALGCWPGLCVIHGKFEEPAAPIIVAAPHVGLMDGLFFLWHSFPRPVVLEPYTKLPLIASLFIATGGLPVPLPAGKANGAPQPAVNAPPAAGSAPKPDSPGAPAAEPPAKPVNKVTAAVRTTILEHKRTFDPRAGRKPIVILPEGVTHNGLNVLKFFTGAFEGGSSVQPIVLSYPFRHFNSPAFLGSTGQHIFRMLLSPYIYLEATCLPVHRPSEEEKADPELMAENVRREMAEALRAPLSAYGARELRKEWQSQKADASKRA